MNSPASQIVTRRRFLRSAAAATATLSAVGAWPAFAAEPAELKRKIKLGVIGCGGRGSWIAKHFKAHGGYEMMAVADYFPEVANSCGDALGVDSARRFSSLSGYKRLLESGVEAVALETPPYFFPAHAAAAVAAGLHVYMAKPVAPDVPGALAIESAAKTAAAKQLCFFVDYQMPTDPGNQEVVKRIHAPAFGKIAQVQTCGVSAGFPDPAKTSTFESRLQHLIWVNDIAAGCDYIGNYDIHAIDAALWAIGERPTAAMGSSNICRSDPHGDSHDVCSVLYEYANGVVHNHFGEALGNSTPGELSCRVHGVNANALLNYWGKATMRSSDDTFSSEVENLYDAGVDRNIASFYLQVTQNRFQNETVRRAVDGVLACILGREAAARHGRLTMEDLIQENKKLELDLTGLKT
jgi:myo-inositol 2-dehydrogenase / D-chiro-inositol 1-dehydrogenase